MTQNAGRLRWITPLPPVSSGISQYSRDLLHTVDGNWSLDVVPEPGSEAIQWRTITSRRFTGMSPDDMAVYHLGNSGYHPLAFTWALKHPGLVVLHDVVLHHARLARFVQRGEGRKYSQLMTALYGSRGEQAARDIITGASVELSAFPLSEDYLHASKGVIVHSDHARDHVHALCPTIQPHVVPMGVPLPYLVDRAVARSAFDLPNNAYVIASITHVNPMKRLHIVLRALRRLIERVPEAMLVIAGSVSPGVNLEQQVAMLGLQRHVRLLGYLSDDQSRFLARASDVAVNLRYPSTGETSASLLRLLGAALPVIVSAHGSSLELADDAVLKLPVDRFEQETLTEFLVWLAGDSNAREKLGVAARNFVEQHHSMGAAVNGYRTALDDAYGFQLPSLDNDLILEDAPVNIRNDASELPVTGQIDGRVADALVDLGLGSHDGTIETVSSALVQLDLNHQ